MVSASWKSPLSVHYDKIRIYESVVYESHNGVKLLFHNWRFSISRSVGWRQWCFPCRACVGGMSRSFRPD